MRKRYTEEQIVGILKEAASGVPAEELGRRYGVCAGTIYRWKVKYADMEVAELRRLKTLEEENSRLKRIVADQMLDIQALKVALGRKY